MSVLGMMSNLFIRWSPFFCLPAGSAMKTLLNTSRPTDDCVGRIGAFAEKSMLNFQETKMKSDKLLM